MLLRRTQRRTIRPRLLTRRPSQTIGCVGATCDFILPIILTKTQRIFTYTSLLDRVLLGIAVIAEIGTGAVCLMPTLSNSMLKLADFAFNEHCIWYEAYTFTIRAITKVP